MSDKYWNGLSLYTFGNIDDNSATKLLDYMGGKYNKLVSIGGVMVTN